MRDGWTETTLGEVADVLRGAVWRKGDEVGAPDDRHEAVVGIGVTTAGGVINRAAMKYVGGLGDKAKRLAAGDTLMVMSNGNHSRIGNAYAIPDDFVGMPFSAFQAAVRVRERDVVTPTFLSILLGSEELQQAFTDSAAGSTGLGNLKVTYLRAFPITLPPLDEQRRIVDLIAAVDDAAAAAEAEAAAARELSDAARRVLFENAEGERDRLGEVVTFAGGYAFPPSEQGRTEGEVPFIKVSDMNLPGNERGIRSAVNWVTGDVKSQLRAKAWPEGTVVFPKVGAALLTEKRRFLTRPTIFDNNVMGLVAGPRLDSAYLLAFMEGVRLSDLAQHGAVPSVNQSHLTSMEIPVPPLSAQHRIVRQYEAVLDAADAARATAESLRTLRSNLLTVLLSGEHEIPSSYDALLGEVA